MCIDVVYHKSDVEKLDILFVLTGAEQCGLVACLCQCSQSATSAD